MDSAILLYATSGNFLLRGRAKKKFLRSMVFRGKQFRQSQPDEYIPMSTMKPKTTVVQYRGHLIKIQYLPTTDEWYWEFTHPLTVNGHNASEALAATVAKRRIDKLIEKR